VALCPSVPDKAQIMVGCATLMGGGVSNKR